MRKLINNNGGFSLVELIIVVSVIGILAIIAIPTFLSQRAKSQDASAKSSLDDSKKVLLAGSSGDLSNYTSSYDAANTMGGLENNYEFITNGISQQENPSTNKKYVNVYLTGDDNNEASGSNPATSANLSMLSSSGKCVSLTLDIRNSETWTINDSSSCGDVSSSTDVDNSSIPNPSGPPGAPIITNNAVNEEDKSPTFNVAVTSGNTAKCRFNGTGSYATSGIAGSSPNFTYTPPGTPLDNDTYKVECIQVTPTGNYSKKSSLPFTINAPIIHDWDFLSAGTHHTCGVINDNSYCWGRNNAGQFGNGNNTSSGNPTQATSLGGTPTAISADGGDYAAGVYYWGTTCSVISGAAKCWGENGQGQLGNGTTTSSNTPVQVTGLTSGVTEVNNDYYHSCAVVSGAAKCWGDNSYGALGNGSYIDSSVPVQVTGLTNGVEHIFTDYYNTCAILTTGSVQCWGDNTWGQLGNGTTTNSTVPVQVTGITSGATDIVAGGSHSCAVQSGGVKCWGDFGGSTPTSITGLTTGVTDVSTDFSHICAVQSGAVKCLGFNNYGQLGLGTVEGSFHSTPTQVTGIASGATAVSVGDFHTCAIVDGDIKCWGRNNANQINDTASATISTPYTIVKP